MHPYILEAEAREQIADMHRVAAAHNRARNAARGRREVARRRRMTWPVAGRRHHRVELLWPDGVSSVVEVPRQSVPAEGQRQRLAGTPR